MTGRMFATRRPRLAVAVALPLLALYALLLFRRNSTAVGGSDSSGYANVARGILSGRLVRPIETLAPLGLTPADAPLFVPLGFVPLPGREAMALFYPPGFPVHIAAASLVLGWELGPYAVCPILGVASVVLFFFVARELGVSRPLAAGGAALLALCPVFVFQAIQPMSDMAATAWCLVAILGALRARHRPAWALAAGAGFGMAVLVRPGNALMVLPLVFAMPASPGLRRLGLFALGAAAPIAGLFLYDQIGYGSPFRTGYHVAQIEQAFAWSFFPERIRNYSLWLSQILTPIVPLGYLAALADPRAPRRDRACLAAWFGSFLVFFCFYQVADSWWYTRFLLPAIPALLVGCLRTAGRLLEAFRSPAARRIAGAAILIAGVAMGAVEYRELVRRGVLYFHYGQDSFADGCRLAEALVPRNSLVLSMEASGALVYYTDLTPMRWDLIPRERFDDLRRRAESAGYRLFALLMKNEAGDARAHVGGRWTFLGEHGGATLWALANETESTSTHPSTNP